MQPISNLSLEIIYLHYCSHNEMIYSWMQLLETLRSLAANMFGNLETIVCPLEKLIPARVIVWAATNPDLVLLDAFVTHYINHSVSWE